MMDDRRWRYVTPTLTERYLAAACLWWASSLIFPLSEFVAGGPESRLSMLAPAWTFGLAFLVLGLAQWYGIARNNRIVRRYAAMLQINVWALVGFTMLLDPPAQLESGLYMLMTWLAADIYRKS